MLTLDREGTLSDEYGSIWLQDCFDYIMLWSFKVAKGHENQGHGTRILKEAIRLATEKDLDCRLDVYEWNDNALHLYRKFGFEIVDSHREWGHDEDGIYRPDVGDLRLTMHRSKDIPLPL